MTIEEKEKIKESIISKLSLLEGELKLLEDAAQPIAPDSAYGRVSRMDAINNKAIVDAALKDKKSTVEHLKFALTNIELEKYGLCLKCGGEIQIKRLISLPYASLCMGCASRI